MSSPNKNYLFQLVDNKVPPAAEAEQGRVRVHADPVRVLAAVCGDQQAGADGALHHPHCPHHQPPAQRPLPLLPRPPHHLRGVRTLRHCGHPRILHCHRIPAAQTGEAYH